MGLNVTVQKGHDFSTGNVTRAALNAGATPTIAVTGSISGSELADGSVTNAKVSSTAAIVATKLGVTSGRIIIGDANNKGSELVPTNSFTQAANGSDGNCGVLIDAGDKFVVASSNVSDSDVGGDVKFTIDRDDVTDAISLKLNIKDNAIYGNHISTSNALDDASIGKNSSGKLAVKNNGVHWTKLYNHKNSAGNLRSAFLSYGASGAAKPTEASSADQILVSAGSDADMVVKINRKEFNLGALSGATKWKRTAHNLSSVPRQVSIALKCNTTATSTHGYTAGDYIYLTGDASGGESSNIVAFADGTYVGVVSNDGANFYLPKKYGGASTPDANTHEGNVGGTPHFQWSAEFAEFDVVLHVSE